MIALLKRSLSDEDDEVRDRAVVLLKSLDASTVDADLKYIIDEPLPMTFAALERSVKAYMAHNVYSSVPLSFSTLPIVEEAYVPPVLANTRAAAKKKSANESLEISDSQLEVIDLAAAVYKMPQFAALGRAFRSTSEISLTETEMEYVVSCVKHIFPEHIVLQFNILNTINDQQLRDVTVNVEVSEPDFYVVEHVIPAPVARYGEHVSSFVSLHRLGDYSTISLTCELAFKMFQVDPVTGEVESKKGFDEESALENLELQTNDFMAKVSLGDFRRTWDQLGTDGEVLEKFALQFKKLDEAVTAVIDFLGMQPVDGTGTISAEVVASKKPHILHLSGVFVGNVTVLVRAQLQMDDVAGVVLKMAVRSADKLISQMVAECIR